MAKTELWKIGEIVKIGFMKLKVTSEALNNQDFGMPKYFKLESLDGSKKYEFVPHNGLYRVA